MVCCVQEGNTHLTSSCSVDRSDWTCIIDTPICFFPTHIYFSGCDYRALWVLRICWRLTRRREPDIGAVWEGIVINHVQGCPGIWKSSVWIICNLESTFVDFYSFSIFIVCNMEVPLFSDAAVRVGGRSLPSIRTRLYSGDGRVHTSTVVTLFKHSPFNYTI